MKNGIANPNAYAVESQNHELGSCVASDNTAPRIGPTQGDQPAENPIPNKKDPT